jgi:YVTN family beta-propeller protein
MRLLLAVVGLFAALSRPCGAAPFAYITNQDSNTVSVIDIATNSVVGSPIAVGVRPYGVAVNSAGTRVYVANGAGGSISVIDTATSKVIATIPDPLFPVGIAINSAGTRVYVTNGAIPGSVTVIDATTNSVIGSPIPVAGPWGIAVNPAGTRVYTANFVSSFGCTVSVIDSATHTVIATVAVGGCEDSPTPLPGGPYAVAVSPDGSRIYVTLEEGFISVIDAATNTMVGGPFSAGPGAAGVAINPAGTRLYVANWTSAGNSVSVVDAATGALIGPPIAVGVAPEGISIDPSGTRVLVANRLSNSVSVIDTATNTVVGAPIIVGSGPVAFGQFITSSGPVLAVQTQVPALGRLALLVLSGLVGLSAIWFLRRHHDLLSCPSELL